MRSVRLDPDLDDRLRRAAEIEGSSVSEFIRRAAAERADTVLAVSQGDRFADILGVVDGFDGQARRSGEAFTDLLVERRHSA